MALSQTFTEKTSAADKSIGFDYQYYYFLYKLLNLKTGESVGLEMLDDVHITVDATLQLLFQLKHTCELAADGNPINLTALDDDVWKTMSNWVKVVTDQNDGRKTKEAQLAFIKKTEFHLVTNKSWNSANQFLIRITEFIEGRCDFSAVKLEVETLHQKTKNLEIKEHIADVLAIDDSITEKFFQKLRFQLDENDIFIKIRRSISEKAIDEADVDEVFNRLDSNIRKDNFIDTKAGKLICISYKDFMTKYRKIFTSSRSNKLTYFSYNPAMPDNLLSQRFVHQLLHISDIDPSELEIIAEYTRQKLRLARNLIEWQQSGQLVGDEIENFHNEVLLCWRNQFRNKFRSGRLPDDIFGAALELLHILRCNRFKIATEDLNTELSNGELYHLSDADIIGWHPGWEDL